MTVATSTSKSGPYAGAGTTGPFTVDFRFLENAHLQVVKTSALGVETVLALDSDYTVAGAGAASGTVTLAAALPIGQALTIVRNVPATQEADYVQNDAFPAESHERALDKLTMLTQQNGEQLARAMKLPVSLEGVSTAMPLPVAGRGLKWNAGGTAVVNSDQDLDALAAGAGGSAAAAAASAAAAAATLDTFDDRYLGVKAADPALDNDGAALTESTLYWNSVAKEFRVFNGTTWQVVVPSGNLQKITFVNGVDFTAGVTTTLNLPTNPLVKANLDIVFDAAWQQMTEYSLDGLVVTFNVPIPGDVGQVEISYTTPLQITSLQGSSGAGQVGRIAPVTGAVATTVEDKLSERVSVKDLGAVGDGVTDDLIAFTKAAKHALTTGADLYLPRGAYFLSGPVVIDNVSVVAWVNFSVVGDGYTTGQGLYQSGANQGTTVVTSGTSAFEVNLTNFFNESVRFRNMSFYNQGARGATVAIQVNKNSTAYTRGWNFSKLGFYNFARCLGIKGQSATIDHNYIGTTKISEFSVFGCDNGIGLTDVILNLLDIDNGMFHGCTAYGITLEGGAAVQNGSGGIFSIGDTHFEGCEPAGIKGGAYLTRVTLDNVSSENTGDVSGLGLITGELNSLRLWVNNQNYPFVFMPPEYRLPRGAIVSASCMIKVSGEGIVVDTPDTVTPVVSNNATYNQADTSTVILSPIPVKTAFSGIKAFKNTMAGHVSNSGVSPDSSALPPGLQPMFVGATKIAANTGESYTAPAAGYLIFTWLAAATGNNGLSVSNITIDGVNKGPTIGFRWQSNFTGAYTILIPVTAGQVLTTAQLTAYTTAWRTPAMIYFRETPGLLSEIATGFPRISRRTETVASAGTLDIAQIGESVKPFGVKVRVLINGGSLGFYEWVARGNGSTATRVLVDIVKSLGVGIAVADHGSPLNTDFYRKTLTNTSGASVEVTIEQEILG